jgi:flagellar biosynthesis protein FlhB
LLILCHGSEFSLEFSQDVLRTLLVAFILAIWLSEGSTFLLDLPKLDKLDLLSFFADLLLGLLLFVVFHLFLR